MTNQPACTRWNADTEIAFDMALRLYGQPKVAAQAIGRGVSAAYLRRDRDPAFAARWDAALDEYRRRTAVPLPESPDPDDATVRERFDGFTKHRRRAFLRKLSETGSVEEACRHVHLSKTAANSLRREHPAFRTAWDRALGLSVATIEQAMIERAVHGVEEDVWHAGKRVGTRRRFSDGLLRDLAKRGGPASGRPQSKRQLDAAAQDAAKAAGGSFAKTVSHKDLNAAILHKLDVLDRRRRAKAAVRAEALLAAGLVP